MHTQQEAGLQKGLHGKYVFIKVWQASVTNRAYHFNHNLFQKTVKTFKFVP